MDQAPKIVSANSLTEKRQSTRKLSRRLSNHEHQVSHMTVQRYLSTKCCCLGLQNDQNSKIDRRTCRKLAEILQDTTHWTKEDWSWVVFSSESPYEVYPSEILRIMSSGLQRKEIQKQKISNNSPIPDIDLKQ